MKTRKIGFIVLAGLIWIHSQGSAETGFSERGIVWPFEFRFQAGLVPFSFGSGIDAISLSLFPSPDNFNALSFGFSADWFFIKNLGINAEVEVLDRLWANARGYRSLGIFKGMIGRIGPSIRYFLDDLPGYEFDFPIALRISGGMTYAVMNYTSDFKRMIPNPYPGAASGISLFGTGAIDTFLKNRYIATVGIGFDSLRVKFDPAPIPILMMRLRFFISFGVGF